MPFQRRKWVVDRVAWAITALILVAAVLGLWGSGPLNRTEATSADGQLSVTYDRFARHLGSSTLEVRIGPEAAVNGTVGLEIDSEFLLDNQIRSTTPEPATVTARGDFLVYEFPVESPEAMTVRFDLRPDPDAWAALQEVRVRIAPGRHVQFRQLVYP